MKAIIIDAKAREVREVEIDGKLAALQEAVGGMIELATELPGGDDLFVNEEGLLLGLPDFFVYQGAHQPFAGNGIILGHDGEGGSAPTKLSAEYVRERVKFLTPWQAMEAADRMGA